MLKRINPSGNSTLEYLCITLKSVFLLLTVFFFVSTLSFAHGFAWATTPSTNDIMTTDVEEINQTSIACNKYQILNK